MKPCTLKKPILLALFYSDSSLLLKGHKSSTTAKLQNVLNKTLKSFLIKFIYHSVLCIVKKTEAELSAALRCLHLTVVVSLQQVLHRLFPADQISAGSVCEFDV